MRQWAQAREHLLQELTIFRDYNDGPNMLIALHNPARLWRDLCDAGLPAAAAAARQRAPRRMPLQL